MAILSVPVLSLSLLPHHAGGAIISYAGQYVAGTYINAGIVQAFSSASTVLASFGSAAGAVASSPVVLSAAALAVVAAGSYCYFYGIPTPVVETLAKLGYGVATKKGFMIAVPKLAVALILLGGAGYVAYRFYRKHRDARVHETEQSTKSEARSNSNSAFDLNVWTTFGDALWTNMGNAAANAAKTAQDAIDRVARASGAFASTASQDGRAAYDAVYARRGGVWALLRVLLGLSKRKT